ncbi:MAG: MBL fold metallo-hydrolase [Chloroflexi bacterium]|nr:MBL fold metallo-hydrolase [Chloroflexota bacterium]
MSFPFGGRLSGVNAYVIEDEHGITLVDCGYGIDEHWHILLEALEARRVPIEHVSRVVLTHVHVDHSGLAGRIVAASRATIWAHEQDLEFLARRQSDQYPRAVRDWLTAHGTPEAEAFELAGGAQPGGGMPRQLPRLETYRRGEKVRVGRYDFEVTWTPGHTPGHVCFQEDAHGLLFCGDHILPDIAPNVGMQPDSDMNPMPGYLASLEALSESDIKSAFPGHGDAFSIQERARELLGRQLSRQQQLVELVAEGPTTAYELGPRVWPDTGGSSWITFGRLRRNAINTLVAHLEALRDQGQVKRSDERPYRYELA